MLRIHLMQNWFGCSDPAMEEALYEVAPLRRFAGLSLTRAHAPDEQPAERSHCNRQVLLVGL
jgi:IS5 family transposase